MSWFYVILRTYPFWAIPTGIALLTGYLARPKNKHKKPSIAWLLISVFLLASSVLFLVKRGHMTAVPFFHNIMNPGQSDFLL